MLKSALPHGAGKSPGAAHNGSSVSKLNGGSEQLSPMAQERAGKALQMLLHREGAGLHASHGLLFVLEVFPGCLQQLCRLLPEDHYDAVPITHQNIAGHDHLSAADHRHIHLARSLTVGSQRAYRLAIDRQAAVLVADAEAPARAMETAGELLADPARRTLLARNIAALAVPDAAERIVDEIEKIW